MLRLPFEAIKVLPHTFIPKNRRLHAWLQCWEHVLMYFGQRDYISSDPKRKAAKGLEAFKETSRPCANLQWPIGPWTSAKWLHIRSTAAWALMSRVEAHLLPSLTIQRRASSQDCLPKTSVVQLRFKAYWVLLLHGVPNRLTFKHACWFQVTEKSVLRWEPHATDVSFRWPGMREVASALKAMQPFEWTEFTW